MTIDREKSRFRLSTLRDPLSHLTKEELAVFNEEDVGSGPLLGNAEITSWPDHEADAKSLDLLCDLRRVLKEYQTLGKGHDVYGLLDYLMKQSVDSEDILNQLEETIAAADLLNRVLG